MQVASKHPLWSKTHFGTEVELEMTPETGRSIKFYFGWYRMRPIHVDWGDGRKERIAADGTDGAVYVRHTYPRYGRFRIRARDARCLSFSEGEGWVEGESYFAAVTSVVDHGNTLAHLDSGGWKGCANLKRFIAPASNWVGQRTFYNCRSLREVVLGKVTVHFDGSFENCSALESYTAVSTGQCWSYVFRGCTRIRELRLGGVTQFATDVFWNTPSLMDIWIDGKTVEQIKQVASSGNIASGYSARFPWGANRDCRFHGTNGIVLGNGTIIHS